MARGRAIADWASVLREAVSAGEGWLRCDGDGGRRGLLHDPVTGWVCSQAA